MSRTLALIPFSLLLLAVVLWAQRYAPPEPVYERLRQDPHNPLIPLDARQDFAFEFEAPAPRIRGIWLQHLFTDPETDVLVQIENRTQAILLLREHIGDGHRHWARIPPSNLRGDRISVTYRIQRSRQSQFPAIVQAVKRSATAPRYPVEILSGELKIAPGPLFPLFELRYDHPNRLLLLLWPLVLAAGFLLYRRDAPQTGRAGFLILLALAAAATSHLAWTQGYETNRNRLDPEHHLAYAEALSGWMDGHKGSDEPARRAAWLDQHPRAHFPLVPALGALLSLVPGISASAAFLWIAGMSSFGVLLLLDYYLVTILQVKPRAAILVLLLFGTHLTFTQSFLYPSPASTLAALSLAACVTLSLRAHRAFPWQWEVLFGMGLLLLALSHPPGVAGALCFVAMAVILDLIRSRSLSLTAQNRSLEFYFLPPAVLFALLALGFGWPRSMAAFRNESLANQHLSTWAQWLPPFLVTIQVLLVAGAGLRLRDGRRIALLIPACWAIYVLVAGAFLLEPFRLRSFLPVLPAVHLLAAAGIQRLEDQRPRMTLAVIFLTAAANLWGAVVVTEQRIPLEESWFARFFTW